MNCLYQKDNKTYCLDDYVDCMVGLNKGELVKLIGIFGPYAYVIKDNEIGWVKYCYLKNINLDDMAVVDENRCIQTTSHLQKLTNLDKIFNK